MTNNIPVDNRAEVVGKTPGFRERDVADFLIHLPMLIGGARAVAKEQARSYRGLIVGASGIFRKPDGSILVADGWNFKPTQQAPKQCAEQTMLRTLGADMGSRLLGLVVASNASPEEIEGIIGRQDTTLKPCADCMAMFDSSPLVGDQAVVITTSVDKNIAEVNSLESLKQPEQQTQTFGPILFDLGPAMSTADESYTRMLSTYLREVRQTYSTPLSAARFALVATHPETIH